MKDIDKLTRLVGNSTMLMFVKSIFTCGFYPILWGWKNADRINTELNKTTFKSVFFGFLVILNIFSALHFLQYDLLDDFYVYLWFRGFGDKGILFMIYISTYGIPFFTSLVWTVWAFKMKEALESYVINNFGVNLRLKGFFTLFFNLLYIVYSINNLKENIEKEKEKENKFADVE